MAAGMFSSRCWPLLGPFATRTDRNIEEDVTVGYLKTRSHTEKEVKYALHEAGKGLKESDTKCTCCLPFIHIGR